MLNKLCNKEIKGAIIKVKLYQTKYENKQYLENNNQGLTKSNGKSSLLIKNIPINAKEEDLLTIFEKFGNILNVRIEKYKKVNNEGNIELISKGFGYISFDNEESTKNAINTLNLKYLPALFQKIFFLNIKYLITELIMTKNGIKLAKNQEFNQEINNLSYYTNSNSYEYNDKEKN